MVVYCGELRVDCEGEELGTRQLATTWQKSGKVSEWLRTHSAKMFRTLSRTPENSSENTGPRTLSRIDGT